MGVRRLRPGRSDVRGKGNLRVVSGSEWRPDATQHLPTQ